MAIPRYDNTVDGETLAAALRDHGCFIVERLAPPELCDRVEEELRPWIEQTPGGADEFSGLNTRRTGALLARAPSTVDMIAHPLVLDVAQRTLGKDGAQFQLHLTQAISIGRDQPEQTLHRDQWCFNFYPFPVGLDVEVSTIWALCDFTEANGATRVAADSHRTEGSYLTGDMPDYRGSVEQAVMPRGSLVCYLGSTVHGGGANTTDTARTGVNVDYSLAWLRQEENQYLSVPRAVAAGLPERVQRLMGYALGAFALGYVDDVRDPITVLDPDRDDPSSFAIR
jgi:ectoine hydroxylase-related dioxygenase (phytanoyl-CoA dioxygenase family)